MSDVTDFYDRLAPVYELVYGGEWDRAVERQGAALDRLIRQLLGDAAHDVLDCSCGIGTQAIGLALRGYAPDPAQAARLGRGRQPVLHRPAARAHGDRERLDGRRARGALSGDRAQDAHAPRGDAGFVEPVWREPDATGFHQPLLAASAPPR